MGTNWNVRRPTPTIEELTEDVAEWKKEVARAQAWGEWSRPYREAIANLSMLERKLDALKHTEEKKEASSKRTPREIVDDLMDRR